MRTPRDLLGNIMEDEIVCTGFFRANAEETISCLDKFEMGGPLQYFLGNMLEASVKLVYAFLHPAQWLDWSNSEAVTIYGFFRNQFMWGCVRVLEGFANGVGRFFAWAGLLMVLQQIMIIFMQRIFAVSEISVGFGSAFTQDVSWWSEELKLYNAMIVCMCATYTFVQGGHVRVDLVYSAISYRAKRTIDMIGALLFMIPAALLTWLYGWFFLWRHLVVPNPSASDSLERLIGKARALRWNVETIGFSPNGFNAYFLFKILLVIFTIMVILQAIAFFYRSYLERKEGEDSAGKYLDKDNLGDAQAELVAEIH